MHIAAGDPHAFIPASLYYHSTSKSTTIWQPLVLIRVILEDVLSLVALAAEIRQHAGGRNQATRWRQQVGMMWRCVTRPGYMQDRAGSKSLSPVPSHPSC